MAEPMTRLRVSDTHEWRLANWEWRIGDPMTWELHSNLPGCDANYIRCADKYEAEMLDAANCLRDADAKKQADGAAKHYREAAQKLMAARAALKENQSADGGEEQK